MKTNKRLILLILGLLSAVGPFSIDMYLPAFDTIAKGFGTDIEKVQLSLTSFFIGIAVGQMIYGPLLDKYGRKKPLLVGLTIYAGASLLCVMTRNVESLILIRFIQALGSCAGMVASRAMVQDYYAGKEAARVFSLLMLIIAISPILAPSVGAFLLEQFDWHYIFIVLFIIGLIILLSSIFFLPESFQGNRTLSLAPRSIISKYFEVFTNSTFLLYCLIASFASSGLYAYLAGSSYVLQEICGLTQKEYGLAFAFVASALILSTQLNRLVLKRWSMQSICMIANICQVGVGMLMVATLWLNMVNLQSILGLAFCYLFCQGFIFPNASAMAMFPFKTNAGSASALLGFLQMGLGAISSAAVSLLHNQSAQPMLYVMCIAAALSLAFHLIRKTFYSESI